MKCYTYYSYYCQLICIFTLIIYLQFYFFVGILRIIVILYTSWWTQLPERTPGSGCTLSSKQDGHAVHYASVQLLIFYSN